MQKRVRRVKGVSINNKKEYWKCNILENIRPLILPCGKPIQEKMIIMSKAMFARENYKSTLSIILLVK